jgi:hypothetical protein
MTLLLIEVNHLWKHLHVTNIPADSDGLSLIGRRYINVMDTPVLLPILPSIHNLIPSNHYVPIFSHSLYTARFALSYVIVYKWAIWHFRCHRGHHFAWLKRLPGVNSPQKRSLEILTIREMHSTLKLMLVTNLTSWQGALRLPTVVDRWILWWFSKFPEFWILSVTDQIPISQGGSPTIRRHDGDEIFFNGGKDGNMIDGPDPEYCNLKLAIAWALHACGAADIIAEMHGNDDDDDFIVQPIYFGGPCLSDEVLSRRLDDRIAPYV